MKLTKTRQLETLYRAQWTDLENSIPRGEGFSMPLLATIVDGYEESAVPIVVVGQQTMGWVRLWDERGDGDHVGALQAEYARYLTKDADSRRRVFFQAARKLQNLINPGSNGRGFLWLDVFVCSQRFAQPEERFHPMLRRLSLLREELAILRPKAVVFFTGPAYDYSIREIFQRPECGIDFEPFVGSEPSELARISCPDLPVAAFRTDHPRTLRLRKRWGVLDSIAGEALKFCAPNA